ncbi:phage major capsid protein [Martelella alba]|uniref:Phage major capsid protein n=1 Tax=Martelella alba TaxID=2590451 RepID=A0A506U6A1_9HYPH|nr:phage major capsid protein [Martelella alba]TPW28604.1 phage major capsid protein [Martelella alba]
MTETKTAAELAAETKAAFENSINAVKAIAEDALGKAKKGEDLSASIKEQTDEALTAMNGLKAQFSELEQKLTRVADTNPEQKSFGSQFVETDEFKSLQHSPRSGSSASMSVKADISTATGVAGGAGAAIVPNRLAGIQGLPQRRMTVRGLLMPGTTDSPNIEYVQETGFNNAAAPVAEGVLKPQSDLRLGDVSTRTKVIAHWFRVNKQTLSDVAQIRSLIDNRLLYGLALAEEAQLLNGDGTGENLHGIIPQATDYDNPLGAGDETSIDKIRLMMLQAVLAEYPATGVVMHPADWAWIELLKDSTGRFIIGNPQGSIAPSLWGLPVVSSPAMSIDKVLVGAFDMGAQIFDQWASRIETGFQNDDFTKNKVTILAEERLALAVYRPEAFIYGDFGRVE